jgi:hypothetical protein
MRLQSSATLICVLAAVGCSQSTASKATSTLDGTAALATFPASPVSAVATDETGRAVAAPVGADGHFSLTLTKGHHYAVSFAGAGGDIPVVWPRASGKLNASFRLSTGGARLDIGSVRYFASAPEGGFHVSAGAPATSTSGPDEECVDGVIAGTTTPCVDDDGKTTCDDGQEVDDDGECENGVDARTGAACTDPPESTGVADPTTAMAIPDRSVPDDVSGCSEEEDDDDGETNDD